MNEELKNTAETTDEAVEIIETEAEEVVSDADNDEVDFFDDENEEKDESDSDGGKEPKPEPNKPWKNKQNAEQAQKRREAERMAEIKKARYEAIKEILGGINPFTEEKIEDETDVEEYLTMKEIEKTGKDPVTNYSRFLKNKAKEQEKAAQAQQNQEEWIRKDRESFTTKHPDIKLDELVGDEMFRTFATGKIGKIPMTKIYADYQTIEQKFEERAKTKAAQILANKAASPGKLSNQNPAPEKSVRNMSKVEFEAMVERVKRGEQPK